MQFPSGFPIVRFFEWPRLLRFSIWLLIASFTAGIPPSATAQTDSPGLPSSPASESSKKEALPKEDQKKLDKYDVNRIGQRGIGHGFNLYSVKREHELGQSLASAFDRNTRLIHDSVVNDYVNQLVQKIVANSDAEVPFTIKVIDSGDIPRAYGLPGGYLYVDSALILSSDGEAELATVIAHEIAHVAARHATRALTRKQFCKIANTMALMTGPAGVAIEDVSGIAGPLSLKKFLRDAEYEADLLGIEYAYSAGYDPQALMGALEKLHAIEVKRSENLAKIPGYHFASSLPFHSKIARSFASYPMTEERIQRLHSEIASFLPNRTDYILDTEAFQEVKSRLLSYSAPILRHHGGDSGSKGPVLRRTNDDAPETQTPSDLATSPPIHEVTSALVANPN